MKKKYCFDVHEAFFGGEVETDSRYYGVVVANIDGGQLVTEF